MLIPVILCGGGGTRLWPLSRELQPKPFLRLPDGETLLQKAYARARRLPGVETVVTVTGATLLDLARAEARQALAGGQAMHFILEPLARNTAPAIAAAAMACVRTFGPHATLLVVPADQLIEDERAFQQAVLQAGPLASGGRVVVFGITPQRPETGFGYIQHEGSSVLRFVEKPALETAREYLRRDDFAWNSGMFCFRAATMLEEFQRHAPGILEAVGPSLPEGNGHRNGSEATIELDEAAFSKAPDISIDFAVMERTTRAAIVRCDIGWRDLGSWTDYAQLTPPDADGNRIDGEAVLLDARNCYVKSPRLVTAIGVEDLVIADTPDALLVSKAGHSQSVRRLTHQLKTRNHPAVKTHATTQRPWGSYTVLDEGPGFKLKRIEVRPGASLSLQYHCHRSEQWTVVSGTAHVINGDGQMVLGAGESTFIPQRARHRLSNRGSRELVLIEVQLGQVLLEEDIVRLEDAYGRAAP